MEISGGFSSSCVGGGTAGAALTCEDARGEGKPRRIPPEAGGDGGAELSDEEADGHIEGQSGEEEPADELIFDREFLDSPRTVNRAPSISSG